MKKRFAALAIMSFLASSFALAQDASKGAHAADTPQKSAAKNSRRSKTNHDTARPTAKKGTEVKHQPKAPCSSVEQEFDEVLRGIYG